MGDCYSPHLMSSISDSERRSNHWQLNREPKIDDRDWSALTLGDRIRQVEVEGYRVTRTSKRGGNVAELP
jgi:hypothetical protein